MIHSSQERMKRHTRCHRFRFWFSFFSLRGFGLCFHRIPLSLTSKNSSASSARGTLIPHENSKGPRRCWQVGCGQLLRALRAAIETERLLARLSLGDFAFMLLK
jgi:hypothetical protein